MQKYWFRIVLVALIMSLSGNAYQALKSLDIVIGGGLSKTSPDGVYEAWAQGYEQANPLRRDKGTLHGEFTVTDSTHSDHRHDAVFHISFEPTGFDGATDFRDDPNIIFWAEDSSQVTYDFGPYTLTLHLVED